LNPITGNSKEIDFIRLDVLCETSDGAIIYCGILREFQLSRDNKLEYIFMTNVFRIKLVNDSQEKKESPLTEGDFDSRFYKIPMFLGLISVEA
jgi:hypothetical protein